MKKFLVSCSIAMISFSFVHGDEVDQGYSKITTTTPRNVVGITTSLENPNFEKQNCHFGLTFAAWQPKMSGVQNLFKYDQFEIDPIVSVFSASEPNFNWGFSVKGELGYFFNYDGWDLTLGYNYFHTKGNKSVSVDLPQVLVPTNEEGLGLTAPTLQAAIDRNLANFATNGKGKLNFNLNDSFLRLKRNFFLSETLSVAPHIGIKSTWFAFREISKFTGGGLFFDVTSLSGSNINIGGLGSSVLKINNHQKLYAVGPRVGIDSKWYMTKTFNIYANTASSLLFNYFNHRLKETYSTYPSNLILGQEKPRRVIPYQNIEIGFGYDKDFDNLDQHLTLQVGYEIQNYVGGSIIGGALGALSIYGFNFNLAFSF